MKTRWLASAAVLLLIGAGRASAADYPAPAPSPQPPTNWTGFYVGLNAGAALGSYKLDSSTSANTYLSNPADVAAVNAAGVQHLKPAGFLGGLQAGYNWQSGHWVAGAEADVDFLHLQGTSGGGAVRYPVGPGAFVQGSLVPGIIVVMPVNQFVVTDYADADWLATFRGRIGYARDNWLFYATGGLALTQLKQDFLYTDGVANLAVGFEQGARTDGVLKAGSVVGLGVEAALGKNLSFKAEYLHVSFGNTNSPETLNNLSTFAPGRAQTFVDSGNLSADMVRLGLNYRFGGADPAPGIAPLMPFKAPALKTAPPVNSAFEFEAGTRLWFSSGSVGAPQPLLGTPPPPGNLELQAGLFGPGRDNGRGLCPRRSQQRIFRQGFSRRRRHRSRRPVRRGFSGWRRLFQYAVGQRLGQYRLRHRRPRLQFPEGAGREGRSLRRL